MCRWRRRRQARRVARLTTRAEFLSIYSRFNLISDGSSSAEREVVPVFGPASRYVKRLFAAYRYYTIQRIDRNYGVRILL